MPAEQHPALRIDLALVHYPVVNRTGETIGSAVTNLDLHDIARAGRTYGIGTYWVVTPHEEQRQLAEQIVRHWTEGHGATANPDRSSALSIVTVCTDLDQVLARTTEKFGERPMVVATCAKELDNTISYAAARSWVLGGRPVVLLLGTAWGLSPEVLAWADAVLPPVQGRTSFNHLSVRSAASIILDRLLAPSV